MTSAWQVKKVGNVTARIRTANIRTIYRNGRPIEVGTIEIEGLSPLRRKRAKDTFLLLTKTDAVAGFKAMRCPMALVWYAILFRAWATSSNAVKLPTVLLRSWGVNRWTWNRAVSRLERAGLIEIERGPGQAVTCHLVHPPGDL